VVFPDPDGAETIYRFPRIQRRFYKTPKFTTEAKMGEPGVRPLVAEFQLVDGRGTAWFLSLFSGFATAAQSTDSPS